MKSALMVLWLAFGAWALLFGFPGLARGLLPGSGMRVIAATGDGFLLSVAIASTWDRCLVQTRTYGRIIVAGVATACFCLLVGATAAVERRNAQLVDMMDSSAWPPAAFDRIAKIKNPKTARLAARMAYHEFGVQAGYRGDAGAPVVFEPTQEEQDSRAQWVATQREAHSVAEDLRVRTANFGVVPTVYLASFPIGTTLYFLWMARRRRAASESE